jgi:hypothetical protein
LKNSGDLLDKKIKENVDRLFNQIKDLKKDKTPLKEGGINEKINPINGDEAEVPQLDS